MHKPLLGVQNEISFFIKSLRNSKKMCYFASFFKNRNQIINILNRKLSCQKLKAK